MSKIFDIEFQRFEFGNSWIVYKVDDEKDLLKVKKSVDGTKDVDFVGIYDGKRLYLMEVTDLRKHRIENRKKLLHGGMVQEFAQKIRDTISAIVGAFHTTENKEQWTVFMKKLDNRNEYIRVILWMEQDRPIDSGELKIFTRSIKKHLSWLTPRVFVESQKTFRNDLGFSVRNLPGAGQS